MSKKDKPESFEQTEYGDTETPEVIFKTVKQLVADYKVENPVTTHNFDVSFSGDVMKIVVWLYEVNLPRNIKDVDKAARDYHKQLFSYLKREYKKKTRQELPVTAQADKSDYTIQKVSLNERYLFTSWTCYRVDA